MSTTQPPIATECGRNEFQHKDRLADELSALRQQLDTLQQREDALLLQLLEVSSEQIRLLGGNRISEKCTTPDRTESATSNGGCRQTAPCTQRAENSGEPSSASISEPKDESRVECKRITFEQLARHLEVVKLTRNQDENRAVCPCCKRVIQLSGLATMIRHLASHLADRSLFSYKCPNDNCRYTSMAITDIKKHLGRHRQFRLSGWNNEIANRCINWESKERFRKLLL